jgi:nicotinate-nucleotide adenylyltransferase
MKRLALDRVWWLVTPGNPLKDTLGLAPLDERMAAARELARHPRMDITGIEAEIGVRYTYDTIRYLVARCRGVRFVWIMGADNLRSFHGWQKWRGIAELVPIAVVDRLGPSLYATGSVAAQALSHRRIPESEARSLPGRSPPAWVLLHGLKSPLSSTSLRSLRRSQKCCRPQAK